MNNPLSRNHFIVEWGGARTSVAEVCGLGIELEAPAFRDSGSPANSATSMPGMLRYPRLVLRRTVQPGDNDFFNWINTAQFNSVTRRDVTVRLLDSSGNPVVVWTFRNAYPVKLEYSPLESRDSAPMMETLELAHDGMTVANS